jgi:hypothetical protein
MRAAAGHGYGITQRTRWTELVDWARTRLSGGRAGRRRQREQRESEKESGGGEAQSVVNNKGDHSWSKAEGLASPSRSPVGPPKKGLGARYTVRIAQQVSRYKALVLYLGAAGCVRLVPVQYHAIIAAGPQACGLVSGQRQVLLRSLDVRARFESWSLSPSTKEGPRGEEGRQVRQVLGTGCSAATVPPTSTSTRPAPGKQARGTAAQSARAHPFFRQRAGRVRREGKEGGSRLRSKHRTQLLPVPSITVRPSVVAGQAAFPPHAQSAPHSKKAALASPYIFPPSLLSHTIFHPKSSLIPASLYTYSSTLDTSLW